jgi:hypothetical protein
MNGSALWDVTPFIDVSDELTVSIYMVEEQVKRGTSKKFLISTNLA